MALTNKLKKLDKIRIFLLKTLFQPKEKTIFNNKNSLLFNSYYNSWGQNISPDKNDLGFGLIHYSLIRNIKPKKILCIGSGRGFAPAIMALACKDNDFGKVDFVDAGFAEEDWKGNWKGMGFWKQIKPRNYFDFFELNNYLDIHIKTTQEFVKNRIGKYDYIYIDGNHTYEGVKKDFLLLKPHIKRNGYILFHDVNITISGFRVKKFIDDMKFKRRIDLMFSSGLTIVQV